jgi:hypothetical protein
VEYFVYLGCLVNDASRTREIKYTIAASKPAFNKKSFLRQIGLKFMEDTSKTQHLEHNIVWWWDLGILENRLTLEPLNVLLKEERNLTEHRTYNKTKEGEVDGLYMVSCVGNYLLKHIT